MKLSLSQLKLIYVLSTGIVLFYVLYIFEAFGIQQGLSFSGHGFLERTIWFGLLNLTFYGLTEYLIAPRLILDNVRNTLFWSICQIIIGGSLIHLLFNFFWDWNETTIHSYLLLLSEYFAMMVIPVAVYQAIRLQIKHKSIRNDIEFHFASENGKDEIKLKPAFLLFIKSDKNYLEVFYEHNQETKSHLIRNRLKTIEDQYQDCDFLKRCHRSFLVNPTRIDKLIQTKGKYELYIGENSIPVSETFVKVFSN